MSSVLDLGTPCAPDGVGKSPRSCLKGARREKRGPIGWNDFNDKKPVIEKLVVKEEYGAVLQMERLQKKEEKIREKGRMYSAMMFERAGRLFDETGDLWKVKLYIESFRAEIERRLMKCLEKGDLDGVILYNETLKIKSN